MLEKLLQAAILTFLLNLLMSLSSPSGNHTTRVAKPNQTPTLTFNLQPALTNKQTPQMTKQQDIFR
ncbi:hypothetical protein NG798_14155 [Ancylothrix sp. C2]|uniref:hypothetical protein n=1 Tax=Ancylothrix sp. D3o TaxID=2953691 RepID=UPI0021BADAC3|nr:hypothetical protein [Ancylothrix sp. D3o]MCT7950938.1 hypothetical protein [Ancylothrix sp. D3o]